MENLTIKELAAYLPHELKVQHITFIDFQENKVMVDVLECLSSDCATFRMSPDYFLDFEENECEIKPILFPLRSLTKEITINGETFVPIIKWEWFGDNFNVKYFDHTNFKPRYEPYYKSEQMLSSYFDIFNLIERGLAIPATETFNPYK